MNRKQLTILIVIGVVIGGLGLVLSNRRSASWQSSDAAIGQKIFKDFPLNDVTQISVKSADGELTLVKQDETWRIKERWNYPANFAQIGDSLRKMRELKSVQAVKVGPSQFGRLELITPDKGTNSGTLVAFKDKGDKAVASLLLGKKYVRESRESAQFGGGDVPIGRYVMVPDASQSVSVVSEPLTEIDIKPDQWLNKDFFKVEKVKSVSVVSTNATNSWKLVRESETGEWQLADKQDGEEFDQNKASSLNHILSSPSFNDIVSPQSTAEQTGLNTPLVATIETFDNFVYTIKVGSQSGEDYHMAVGVEANISKERAPGQDEKPEDKDKLDKEFKEKVQKLEDKLKKEKEFGNWTYIVTKWTVDPVLKERKDFMADKKTDAQAAEGQGSFAPPPLPPGLNLPPGLIPQ